MHQDVRCLARAIFLACAFYCLFPAASVPSAAQTGLNEWKVPFLTLRNRTGSSDPGTLYGDERSTLSAGWCRLRQLELGGLSSISGSLPPFIGEEFLRVDQVIDVDPPAMMNGAKGSAGDSGAVIYVHGYYISFEKGCRRAALFQQNAGLEGRFLWFSWPSDGSLAYYMHDEADLYWSVPDLADAIIEMERRFGSGVVDVVGHSLGARGVVLALYELANRRPEIRVDDVVLLAPDMDFGIFQRILPRISGITNSMTVYVAEGDRPLALSAQLHGYPRLGETGNDVATLRGVEVVDLSDLPTSSPTGHLYHLYSKDVGDDLNHLLLQEKQAADRAGLQPVGGNLWRLLQRAR